jgi:DNA-binding LacI/PurR family transcriptional regulator
MKANLNDIAQRVGVSKSLVSMYLNKHRLAERIAPATKRRIDRAVEELNYQPSFAARALSKGTTKTIGMICGNIASPYSANLVEDALQATAERGYQLLLGLSRWIPEEEEKALENLLQRQIDGLVCCINPDVGTRTYRMLQETSVPVLKLNDPSPDFCHVCPDLTPAMRDAVALLAARGHRRIHGHFYSKSVWPKAFLACCAEYGITPDLGQADGALPNHGLEPADLVKRGTGAVIMNGFHAMLPQLPLLDQHPEHRLDIVAGCDDYTMYPALRDLAGTIYTDTPAIIRKSISLLLDKAERPAGEIPRETKVVSRFLPATEVGKVLDRCPGRCEAYLFPPNPTKAN